MKTVGVIFGQTPEIASGDGGGKSLTFLLNYGNFGKSKKTFSMILVRNGNDRV